MQGEILSSTFELSTDCYSVYVSHEVAYKYHYGTTNHELQVASTKCPVSFQRTNDYTFALASPENIDTADWFHQSIGRDKVHDLALLSEFTAGKDVSKIHLVFGMDPIKAIEPAGIFMLWEPIFYKDFIIKMKNKDGSEIIFKKKSSYQINYSLNGHLIDYSLLPERFTFGGM